MSKAKAPVRKDEKKSSSCCCEEPLCALGPEELATVRELAEIATEFDLAELGVDACGGIRIVRRQAGGRCRHSGSIGAPPRPLPRPLQPRKGGQARRESACSSPRLSWAPSTVRRLPRRRPSSDVGQSVRKGQVVCIVEAMKLMNEIESEFDGKILEILVKNAEHVEYGQPLFRIEKA